MNPTKQNQSFDFHRRDFFLLALIFAAGCLFTLSAFGQIKESGKLFEGKNATIYYEVRGAKSGVPLFVVNGGPGADHTYLHSTLSKISALDELAKKRPVIFYDQRGVGQSPALKTGQSITTADQVADLDALREFLGYEHIDIFGHSYGGFLAMAYAAAHPERIAHLVLSDSEAPKPTDTIFLFDRIYPETNARMEARNLKDAAERKAYMLDYFSMIFYSPANRDAYLAKVVNPTMNTEISDALWKDMEKIDLNPEIAKFKFPTLVMTGRFDINVAPSIAYKIHQTIPDSKFVVFDECGHMPFYEQQIKFVQTMNDFFSGK